LSRHHFRFNFQFSPFNLKNFCIFAATLYLADKGVGEVQRADNEEDKK